MSLVAQIKTTIAADSWTPRDLPGGIYCSPGCGCRCTRAAFERATAEAASLAGRMGAGWRPHVWENGGWHYRAVKGESRYHAGLAEIHPLICGPDREVQGYAAWINSDVQGVGQAITDDVGDPIEALGLALQEARTRALRFDAELNSISDEAAP